MQFLMLYFSVVGCALAHHHKSSEFATFCTSDDKILGRRRGSTIPLTTEADHGPYHCQQPACHRPKW